jgi:hypothetical protein
VIPLNRNKSALAPKIPFGYNGEKGFQRRAAVFIYQLATEEGIGNSHQYSPAFPFGGILGAVAAIRNHRITAFGESGHQLRNCATPDRGQQEHRSGRGVFYGLPAMYQDSPARMCRRVHLAGR